MLLLVEASVRLGAPVLSIRKATMEVLLGIPQSKVSNATGSKVNSWTKTLYVSSLLSIGVRFACYLPTRSYPILVVRRHSRRL